MASSAFTASTRAPEAGRPRAQTGYVLRLVVFTGALWALPAQLPGIERIMVRATVGSLAIGLRALGPNARLVGDTLEWGGSGVRIVAECTSLSTTLLYIGALFAYWRSWGVTLLGALAGTAVLWGYNVLRILALLWVLRFWPAWFDIVHVYLWQSVSLVVVLGCFLAWAALVDRRHA